VVHATGSGAHGVFEVTGDITRWTKAERLVKKTEVFVRFSTVGGEEGSGDTERDPRGFAVKFYTEDGKWDMVGNSTPVFFVRDALKFSDFIHTQMRDPHTNLKSPTMMWDFWSLSSSGHDCVFQPRDPAWLPAHEWLLEPHVFTDQCGRRVWCKWHFKTMQGIQNFHREEAIEMLGKDPDFSQRDLLDAIERGESPKWCVCVQIMDEDEESTFRYNPFDLTKLWPQREFPLHEVGMLQAHILSYPDAHRHRMGVNYDLLPVNKPKCPVHTYRRDGHIRFDENGDRAPN
jgi:catalase